MTGKWAAAARAWGSMSRHAFSQRRHCFIIGSACFSRASAQRLHAPAHAWRMASANGPPRAVIADAAKHAG